MRLLLALAFCVMLTGAGPAAAADDPARFAVYRVDLVDDESAPPYARKSNDSPYWRGNVSQDFFLAHAVKLGGPVLTDADIEDYCWNTNRVQLTDDGARKWEALGSWGTPLSGLPLLIETDGRPQYGAMLWNPLSSAGCRLPQIWCTTLDNRLIMGGLYMTADGDTVYRENFDPDIRQVMLELGKLSEDCEEN